jgi:gamma-glutamyltranspeptidase/glutathione hydrolase
MDDFSVKPGAPNVYKLIGAEANAIAPGKRPVSSSTPAFIETEHGLMIVGSPGGSYIIGMSLLATLDFIGGRSALEIVSAPRIHHQYYPDVLSYEPGALSEEERAALTARGHRLKETQPWGNMQVVTWDYASGKVEAAADPRGAGAGIVH